MIAFVIWSLVAVLFLWIGLAGWRSKKAVGFFTYVNPPEVTDVRKYNHAVSALWIAAAVIFELMGITLLFFEQNSPVFILVIFGVMALVIGMMIGYFIIEKKYKR